MSSLSAKSYQRVKRFGFFISLAIDIALLAYLAFGELSMAMASFAESLSSNLIVTIAVYFALFCLIFLLVHLPQSYFFGFVWEHKFKLSTQTFRAWVVDEIKKNLLGFILALILVEAIYQIFYWTVENWWIWASCCWIFFSVIFAKVLPNVIIPIFFKYSDLQNEDLKKRIKLLFESCRIPLKDVYAINFSSKTKKANAFVCGLGESRRVVLSDTLLSHFSNDEIETVIAHELAHYKYHDVLKMLLINSIAVFAGMWIVKNVINSFVPEQEMYNIGYFPLVVLVLVLFNLIVGPFLNAFSRFIERKADLFSLEKTQKPNEFISMMRKLGEMNLTEFEPPAIIEFLFYDHPTIKKRIEFAQNFKTK